MTRCCGTVHLVSLARVTASADVSLLVTQLGGHITELEANRTPTRGLGLTSQALCLTTPPPLLW